jgi:hypothetical protein
MGDRDTRLIRVPAGVPAGVLATITRRLIPWLY